MATAATANATADQHPIYSTVSDLLQATQNEHGLDKFGNNIKRRFDEDAKTADIIFATSDQLARAIGSQGQNVRLASELTGFKLDMMLEDEYRARQQNEAQQYLDMFVTRLDIDEGLAMALVEMGFTSLEEIAYVPAETFDEIDLDEDTVTLLQSRAKEAALADALKQQENVQEPSEELLNMQGMTQEIAYALAGYRDWETDRKSTRLNSSHRSLSRMPSSA